MSRGINDGTIVLGSLKFPQGNINSDTTFTLSLQLVEHPGILE
uniref:Translation elongation factor 1 n=1 Tax=Rhizophora mucronata TaxID=61149 RepID=A0A2P2KEB4_RHIMU